jgi:hypothetical protein
MAIGNAREDFGPNSRDADTLPGWLTR